MITVYPYGNYSHRQPLAYAPIQAQCLGAVQVCERMQDADIVTISHSKDLESFGTELRQRLLPHQRLVLLSEEPFWDTIWGAAPLQRHQIYKTADGGDLAFTFINHHCSALYDFAAIPYFLLTDHHFSTRYARWFARNAHHSPQDWQRHFQTTQWQSVFMLARRTSPRYEVAFPEANVFSICNQRTAIAENCRGPQVRHIGQGWQQTQRRQELADWHLDKFLGLDGQVKFLCAIENTHQRPYVSEKLFDAFAIGAVPLYIADSGHRVHDFAPSNTWVNLLDVPANAAMDHMENFRFDAEFFENYAATQRRLADLFGDPSHVDFELDRVKNALVADFTMVLDYDG